MLSANALERASQAYRRGYNDGGTLSTHSGPPNKGTFGNHDYNEGYKAGINDKYWDLYRSGETALTRDQFLSQYIGQ